MKINKYIIMTLLFAAYYQSLVGQSHITGTISDLKGSPIPYATISFFSNDTLLLESVMSDSVGYFKSFSEFSKSNIRLYAKRIGYVEFDTVLANTVSEVHSIKITLNKMANLKEVSVNGTKPLFEKKVDRLVFNVENSVITAGENLIDILRFTPGVTIDSKENVYINGKSSIKFMIDDKDIYVSGDQLINYLKSISSNSIKKIEIMTSPSAKYDAEGFAIINVITKKNTRNGFNGDINVSYLQGVHSNYIGGINMSYKKGNANIYASYSTYSSVFSSNSQQYRQLNYDLPNSLVFDQYNFIKTISTSSSLIAGIDWNLTSKQTVSVSIDGNYASYINPIIGITNVSTFLNTAHADSFFSTDNRSYEFSSNGNANVQYSYAIDTFGQAINIGYASSYFNDYSHSNYYSTFYDGNENKLRPSQTFVSPSLIKVAINTLKINYTFQQKAFGKFETGFKSSYINTDNDIQFFNLSSGVSITDTTKTNHYIYKENINAVFVNWNKEFGKNSVQAGLRAEQTHTNGNALTINNLIDRNYTNLFPSIYVQRAFNEKNQLSFSYNRRIKRPDYSDLNPFQYYYDPYTYQTGDPYLQPEIINTFDLSHVLGSKYVFSYNFIASEGATYEATIQNQSNKALIYIPINLTHFYSHSLNFTIPVQITKAWRIDGNYSFVYKNYDGVIQGKPFNSAGNTFNINISNSFKFPRNYSIQVFGYYQAPSINGIQKFEAQSNISVGAKKNFLNGKGNVKISVSDIFKQQIDDVSIDFFNQHIRTIQHYDSRKLKVTLTYNFSNGIQFSQREKEIVNEDEKDRVKQK